MPPPPSPPLPRRRAAAAGRRRRPLIGQGTATLVLAAAAALAQPALGQTQQTLAPSAASPFGANAYNARIGGGKAFDQAKAIATDPFGATYVVGASSVRLAACSLACVRACVLGVSPCGGGGYVGGPVHPSPSPFPPFTYINTTHTTLPIHIPFTKTPKPPSKSKSKSKSNLGTIHQTKSKSTNQGTFATRASTPKPPSIPSPSFTYINTTHTFPPISHTPPNPNIPINPTRGLPQREPQHRGPAAAQRQLAELGRLCRAVRQRRQARLGGGLGRGAGACFCFSGVYKSLGFGRGGEYMDWGGVGWVGLEGMGGAGGW